MPAFNGEQYIALSIQSVLNQRDVDLELIVVNDGSTDRTLEILQEFAAADNRVRVISRSNSGRPAFPKNDGIAAARGDYICFLDQDDLYNKNRSWQLLKGLERHPEWVATFHDLQLIDREGKHLPDTYLSSFNFLERAKPYMTPLADDWFECGEQFYIYQCLQTSAVHTQSVMIAKNRLSAGSISYDTQFTHVDDGDLWMRLHLQGKIGYLHQVLSSYRQHPDSLTSKRDDFLVDKLKMWSKNFERVGNRLSPSELQQLKVKLSRGFGDLGDLRYQQGRLAEARLAYRTALQWEVARKTLIAYSKSFIPPIMLQLFKKLRNNKSI